MAEKTYNITLTANHQSLTAEYLPIAAESVQYLTAKVVCETEDWTGREIKALFGQGCTVYEIPVTGGEITAKQQLNLTAGDWCVWLVGNSARDGEVIPRITTNVAHISVAPTGGTEGNPFPTIPPTAEEQLRADMGNLADLTTEDKSSLVAAINEAAASGGTADAVTYTPQTLTDEQQAQARKNITVTKSYQIPTRVSGNDLLVDGWAAVGGYPSGFDIIAFDIERGALPYFVADDCIFLCTGIRHSARDSIIFVSGTVDYSDLAKIVYKNAYWESGTSIIHIQTMEVSQHAIEERAQTAYFYVGSYGYIYGQHYEELAGDNPKQDIPKKYPFAVVDGKFKNAVLPLFGIYEELKQIVYARTDATPDGNFKIQGLIVGDQTTPFQVIDIDIPVYIKPADGIPKTDLEQSVQTSLAKADTAISLGLTSATPGQIIKVKAVQDGKPTEWEAVDMPGGGVEWYEVIDIETAENVNDLIISNDKNGRPISGYHALAMVLCVMIPADSTQTSTNGTLWVYPMVTNDLGSGLRIITNVATWKTIPRNFNYFYAGSNRAIFIPGLNGDTFDGSYNNVFDGVRLYIHNAGDHLPTGTKVRCLVLSKGWTA